MKSGKLDQLFTGLRKPTAPLALRERVLDAALRVEPLPPRSLEDRLFFSRPLRLAWAAAVVGLLAVNLQLGPVSPVPPSQPRIAEAPQPEDLLIHAQIINCNRPRGLTQAEAMGQLDSLLRGNPTEIRKGDPT